MKMEQTGCSEMSAYKIQTPGNYPEESIQHSEHGESLKSRTFPSASRLVSHLTNNVYYTLKFYMLSQQMGTVATVVR